MGSNQLHSGVLKLSYGISLPIGAQISQISCMPLGSLGGTMVLSQWIEVRSSRCAPRCIITELVNVETAFSVGVIAGDVVGYNGG